MLERINFFDNIKSSPSSSPSRTSSPYRKQNSNDDNDDRVTTKIVDNVATATAAQSPMTPASTLNNSGHYQPKKVPSVYEIFQLDKDGHSIYPIKSLSSSASLETQNMKTMEKQIWMQIIIISTLLSPGQSFSLTINQKKVFVIFFSSISTQSIVGEYNVIHLNKISIKHSLISWIFIFVQIY